MQGWRKRMEDSHISDMNLLNGNVHVFGVFDGHGGEEVAQFVKKYFTEEICKNPLFKNGDMQNALIENFLHIDDLLVESSGKSELKKFAKISKEKEELQNQKEKNKQVDMFKQLFDPKGQEDCDIALMTGCTAHACIIDENQKKLYFANSGDSRGVLCRNGIAYPMSEDHKPDLETEKSRIYKADGWVSDGRVKGKYIFYI
jgi:protein phosphatase 1G